MQWFYAEAGQQKGPVNDDRLEQLVRDGVIQSATLVWREGMAEWKPFAQVRTVTPPPIPAPAKQAAPEGHVLCTECGKAVPVGETVAIGAANLCPACKPIYVQKLREGSVTFATAPPSEMRYAGFWIRVGAYLIDQAILMIVSLPLTILFTVKAQQALQGGMNWASYFANLGASSAVSTVVSLLYNWLFVGRYAATPGKMILRIKVVTANGGKVTYLRAFGRFWGHLVSGLPCMFGYLMPIWDAEKRALHHHLCNTRVVYK